MQAVAAVLVVFCALVTVLSCHWMALLAEELLPLLIACSDNAGYKPCTSVQDITEMGGGELILSPSTGSAVSHPVMCIRSTSIPTPAASHRYCPPASTHTLPECVAPFRTSLDEPSALCMRK